LRINEAAQKALGLPDAKVHNNIQKYGNTTSATLPLCFQEAREAGKAPAGALIAFAALGAGLHWGAVLLRSKRPFVSACVRDNAGARPDPPARTFSASEVHPHREIHGGQSPADAGRLSATDRRRRRPLRRDRSEPFSTRTLDTWPSRPMIAWSSTALSRRMRRPASVYCGSPGEPAGAA
jgi:hypothetical protein